MVNLVSGYDGQRKINLWLRIYMFLKLQMLEKF